MHDQSELGDAIAEPGTRPSPLITSTNCQVVALPLAKRSVEDAENQDPIVEQTTAKKAKKGKLTLSASDT